MQLPVAAIPKRTVASYSPSADAFEETRQEIDPIALRPWRLVTLGQLIDTGLVGVPLDISRHYRGTDLAARIESADRIVFDGAAYDSLSTAGGMARRSVVGDKPGRAYPQTNGWTFWEFRAADGSRRQLDTLRRELHERKVVRLPASRRTG